jgi:ABC-type phosphate transport system substrate-binding protein
MTIQELIDKLNKIENKDLHVYVRSKYSGNTKYFDEYAINPGGISEMENEEGNIDRVVFLY